MISKPFKTASDDLIHGPSDKVEREALLEEAARRVEHLGFGPTLTGAPAYERAIRHANLCHFGVAEPFAHRK